MEEMPNIDPNRIDRVIAEVSDNLKKEADDNLIRLSTGVVLKAKQVNPNLLIRIMTKIPRPTPPIYRNEAMGRDMENPDDPAYIERVNSWKMDYSSGLMNVLVAHGTDIFSIPEGLEGVDGKNWVRDYASLGLPVIADSPSWRYTTWIMFVAAVNEKDNALLSKKVMALSGVKEADVQNAENFPKSD